MGVNFFQNTHLVVYPLSDVDKRRRSEEMGVVQEEGYASLDFVEVHRF